MKIAEQQTTAGRAEPSLAPAPWARRRDGPLPWIEDPRSIAPREARVLSPLFFARLRVLDEGCAEHRYARETLIGMNGTLVQFVAGRFRSRGSGDLEDIAQVGTIGLIKAIDRYDPYRAVLFNGFAVPYIAGEIKRHFRDSTWAVHVPRRLQELRTRLRTTGEALATELNRAPTVAELAAALGIGEAEVTEGMRATNGYRARSLDAVVGAPEAGHGTRFGPGPADLVGDCDPALELAENRQALVPLLAALDPREQQVVGLRFGPEMTQAEIGAALGISQMHVSRILAGALRQLRTGMLAGS
ncbi:SigB/SigF/SigG family RNA polymerase sigma factor [Streptomyces sp. NPDC086091]|uniref:SigB/SigF/SigG family RNA polymerase sigma factor n=1 Tax=Streptomyces sp. NPDC086091 TaxID=3365751 RepID=UPI00382A0838